MKLDLSGDHAHRMSTMSARRSSALLLTTECSWVLSNMNTSPAHLHRLVPGLEQAAGQALQGDLEPRRRWPERRRRRAG
jgi:hypothetical protein